MSVLRTPVSAEDHWLGNPNSPITLVEYGDYQCPFCGAAQPEVKRVLRALQGQVALVFRHFPLTQIHHFAMIAAEAAEAAGAQGRFWQMHELLFANQQALDPDSLLSYADELGLDLDRFSQELSEHTYAPRIRRDFLSGVRSGVNGTPTFFINGYRHEGAFSADALLESIRGEGATP